MRLIIALIVVVVTIAWLGTASACEDHAFFRVGAGKQGNWLAQKGDGNWIGESGIAADISLGYRWPVEEWLWLDVTAQHKSQWDKGWPVNDKDEDELDSITFGLEFRL